MPPDAMHEAGEVIVGVENAAQSIAAFVDGVEPFAPDVDLGHPTVGARFTADGNAKPGLGRIGGELYYDQNQWWINDASGRYSKGRTEDPLELLNNVAKLFMTHCELVVRVSPKQR